MAPKNLSFKIILGSSSMARRKILADMGYEFTVMADAIISRLKTTDYMEENTHPTLLITADTCTKELLEKSHQVYFHDIPDEIIDSLIEEGIILNVAGGLMLEHPLTLPFVDTLIGTADSVMGLPRSLTEKLIEEAL